MVTSLPTIFTYGKDEKRIFYPLLSSKGYFRAYHFQRKSLTSIRRSSYPEIFPTDHHSNTTYQ
uniref:AlNc14C1035G12732 protein n=1 Tax=Albugo laibachii Nc14 TaxID=890382 RepID=F0WDR8_9STRA|nr:AlNc14C69G4787 [Albugo laibachii Nc14]CCA28054.1 AlNc14C1035G12732 [Albugo laibachii Nc14]|eukprot:CCA28054.1 AlNc14C1035G12732 [Albugo laibachii Nc14]